MNDFTKKHRETSLGMSTESNIEATRENSTAMNPGLGFSPHEIQRRFEEQKQHREGMCQPQGHKPNSSIEKIDNTLAKNEAIKKIQNDMPFLLISENNDIPILLTNKLTGPNSLGLLYLFLKKLARNI